MCIYLYISIYSISFRRRRGERMAASRCRNEATGRQSRARFLLLRNFYTFACLFSLWRWCLVFVSVFCCRWWWCCFTAEWDHVCWWKVWLLLVAVVVGCWLVVCCLVVGGLLLAAPVLVDGLNCLLTPGQRALQLMRMGDVIQGPFH